MPAPGAGRWEGSQCRGSSHAKIRDRFPRHKGRSINCRAQLCARTEALLQFSAISHALRNSSSSRGAQKVKAPLSQQRFHAHPAERQTAGAGHRPNLWSGSRSAQAGAASPGMRAGRCLDLPPSIGVTTPGGNYGRGIAALSGKRLGRDAGAARSLSGDRSCHAAQPGIAAADGLSAACSEQRGPGASRSCRLMPKLLRNCWQAPAQLPGRLRGWPAAPAPARLLLPLLPLQRSGLESAPVSLPSCCSLSHEQFPGMPAAVIHTGTQLCQLANESDPERALYLAPAAPPGAGSANLDICRENAPEENRALPQPEFNTLRCREPPCRDPEARVKRRRAAFPGRNDFGSGRRLGSRRCKQISFSRRSTCCPEGTFQVPRTC